MFIFLLTYLKKTVLLFFRCFTRYNPKRALASLAASLHTLQHSCLLTKWPVPFSTSCEFLSSICVLPEAACSSVQVSSLSCLISYSWRCTSLEPGGDDAEILTSFLESPFPLDYSLFYFFVTCSMHLQRARGVLDTRGKAEKPGDSLQQEEDTAFPRCPVWACLWLSFPDLSSFSRISCSCWF